MNDKSRALRYELGSFCDRYKAMLTDKDTLDIRLGSDEPYEDGSMPVGGGRQPSFRRLLDPGVPSVARTLGVCFFRRGLAADTDLLSYATFGRFVRSQRATDWPSFSVPRKASRRCHSLQ
jgi:hypothetical protein